MVVIADSAVVEVAKAVAGVATAVAAIIGVFAAARGANTVREKTTPSGVTRSSRRKRPKSGDSAATARSGTDEVIGREVEGYIVRFLIFYLVLQLWSAINDVVFFPLDRLGGFSFGYGLPRDVIDIAIALVYALIFLTLGLPLLIDIYRRYGIGKRRRTG